MFSMIQDQAAAGVLDALLGHSTNFKDLTSDDALLKMVPPLDSTLESYRHHAVAANKTPAQMVRLEAAAQGW